MFKKRNQKKKFEKNEQKNCDFSIILRECNYLIPCTHTCSLSTSEILFDYYI